MKLGQTITEIRKKNHLTQENLAEIFHVTRQTVSNWENICQLTDRDMHTEAVRMVRKITGVGLVEADTFVKGLKK